MRKGIKEGRSGAIVFNQQAIDNLQSKGYKYFQIKGFTIDLHYDYVEPYYILLVPMKTLPTNPADKDIYETIDSGILERWVTDDNHYPEIWIASN
jgi:hypothetical protein